MSEASPEQDAGNLPASTWTDVEAPGVTTGRHEAIVKRGEMVGRYVVIDVLGSGAMGTVYAAFDPELERKVALKLLHVRDGDDQVSSRGHARLLREARALARLSDPHVVGVHDVGVWRTRAFVAMELVDGQTLAKWCRAQPRSWREIVAVLRDAARGLAAAHRAGVVHADFKPDNVIVGTDGRACVGDFGLARAVRPRAIDSRITAPPGTTDDGELSRTRLGIGTPAYMAPEQFLLREPTPQSDQFSFGVTAFEALWGMRPFAGATMAELASQVIDGQMREPPAEPRVPTHVRRLVLRALASDPADRHPDMDVLVAELERDPVATRRKVLALSIGGFVVASVAVVSLRAGEGERPCSGAEERTLDLWSAARKAEMTAAFERSAVAYAEDARVRVESAIDAWMEQWRSAYVDACEATHVRHEQSPELLDRRIGCLSRALEDSGALVDVLSTGDPKVVARASDAVDELPRIDRCADLVQLLGEVTVPDGLADAVADVRSRLARARAQESAGLYDDAVAVAVTLAEEADALSWLPLRAEAHSRLGSIQARRGEYPAAVTSLREAWAHALAGGDDRLATEVAIDLVEVLGHGIADLDGALEWSEHARAEATRIDAPANVRADLHDAIGIALAAGGRWSDAHEQHREALALRDAAPDGRAHDGTLLNAARALEALGREGEGLDLAERALAMRVQSKGPHHPDVAIAHNTVGNTLFSLGRYEDALAHFEDALAIRREALGPRHPHTGTSLNNLGNVWVTRGEPMRAEEHYREALEIWTETLGAGHPHTLDARSNLAVTLEDQGRYDEALEHARAVVDQHELSRTQDAEGHAMALGTVANILDALQRYDESIEHHRRALAILEHAADVSPRAIATARTNYAIALYAAGRAAEADSELRRALGEFPPSGAAAERAYASAWLARCELARGRRDDGLARLERAIADADGAAAPATMLAEMRGWLAQERAR